MPVLDLLADPLWPEPGDLVVGQQRCKGVSPEHSGVVFCFQRVGCAPFRHGHASTFALSPVRAFLVGRHQATAAVALPAFPQPPVPGVDLMLELRLSAEQALDLR